MARHTTFKYRAENFVCKPVAGLCAAALASLAQAAPFAYVTRLGTSPVAVLDTANGNAVVASIAAGDNPTGVAISPDGAFVYVVNQHTNNVTVIDSASHTVVATIGVGSVPSMAAMARDGARVYVSNSGDGTLSVIDTASRSVVATVPVGAGPFGVALSRDGSTLYVANNVADGTVTRIDTATLAPVGAPIAVGSRPIALAVSPDGAFVHVPNLGSDTVSLIATATHAVVATVPVGDGPVAVAFTLDGAHAYVSNRTGGSVSVIDTASRNVVATIALGAFPAGIDSTPDGRSVLVATSSGVATLATATRQLVATTPLAGLGAVSYGRFIGRFAFAGFQSPVDNLPTANAMKAGAAVPVKWSLGGDFGLGIVAAGYPQSQPVQCPGAAPVDVVELTVTAGNSSLGYDVGSDTYSYAWKTQKAWAGSCRQFTLRLNDGTEHKALFQFR